ncbi:MAG: hypothetical protein ABJB01_12995 [Rudaea sp.]
MYTELPEPFTDWTVDDNGTIYTASGYRCTPQMIESALWLMGFGKELYGKKLMFADDQIARPIYSIEDIRVPPKRPIRVQRPKAVLQDENEDIEAQTGYRQRLQRA